MGTVLYETVCKFLFHLYIHDCLFNEVLYNHTLLFLVHYFIINVITDVNTFFVFTYMYTLTCTHLLIFLESSECRVNRGPLRPFIRIPLPPRPFLQRCRSPQICNKKHDKLKKCYSYTKGIVNTLIYVSIFLFIEIVVNINSERSQRVPMLNTVYLSKDKKMTCYM